MSGWIEVLGVACGAIEGVETARAKHAEWPTIGLVAITLAPVGLGVWQVLEMVPDSLRMVPGVLILVQLGVWALARAARALPPACGHEGAYLGGLLHGSEALVAGLALSRLGHGVVPMLLDVGVGFLIGLLIGPLGRGSLYRQWSAVFGLGLLAAALCILSRQA